jgi:hypothetical protein
MASIASPVTIITTKRHERPADPLHGPIIGGPVTG